MRKLQRHADPYGARRLARECPVITASDLIRDRAERRLLDQSIAEGGRGRRPRVASMATASQSTRLCSTTSQLASPYCSGWRTGRQKGPRRGGPRGQILGRSGRDGHGGWVEKKA